MNFDDIVIFVCDPSRCIREEDDPAKTILLSYPFEMSIEAKCSWCGQLLGIYQFWKSAFKKPATTTTIGPFMFACQEMRSQVLVILGWKTPINSLHDRLKVEMRDNLQFLVGIFEFFCDAFSDDRTWQPDQYQSLLQNVLSLFSLRHGDSRIKSTCCELFNSVAHIKTMGHLILQKSALSHRGSTAQVNTLFGMVSFRADVIADQISKSCVGLRRFLLIACMRTDAGEVTSGVTSALDFMDGITEQKFYRVYLSADDYYVLRLALNVRVAADSVYLNRVSNRNSEIQEKNPGSLSSKRLREGNFPLLVFILRYQNTCLSLLIDQARVDANLRRFCDTLSNRMLPLLNALETSAVDHILRSQMSSSLDRVERQLPQKISKFVLETSGNMFLTLPDVDTTTELLFDMQQTAHNQLAPLQHLYARWDDTSCTIESSSDCQTFILEKPPSW